MEKKVKILWFSWKCLVLWRKSSNRNFKYRWNQLQQLQLLKLKGKLCERRPSIFVHYPISREASQVVLVVKNKQTNKQTNKQKPACQYRRLKREQILRSPRGGNGNPLQYSYLENSMDRGAGRATVFGVARVGHNWACTCACVHAHTHTHTHTHSPEP